MFNRQIIMLLDKIVNHKIKENAKQEAAMPLGILTSALSSLSKPRNFKSSIRQGNCINIIAEIKQASPIKGLLCADFDPVKLAESYRRGGAGAISVITEEHFFRGNPAYIAKVKKAVDLPVLRKDFLISEYQVYESRIIGADAVLLITSILDNYLLKRMITLSANLGMTALVEVHNKSELDKALSAGAKIIGINNRNLKTFKVNLSTTLELIDSIPADIPVISESGITARAEIELLEQKGIKAVLIGEALVRSADQALLIQELRGKDRSGAGLTEKRVSRSCG